VKSPRYALVVVTLILLSFAGTANANGSAGGTVNAINVNRSWQGLMVQLNIPLSMATSSDIGRIWLSKGSTDWTSCAHERR
jgi:hypothetical protein